MNSWEADLVVLVPCKDMESAVQGLLSRPKALGIRQIQYCIYIHVERDPGCLNRSHDFLRSMSKRFSHALVMFDRHGCGRESRTRDALEQTVKGRLSSSGWNDRANVVVLDPELEVWVWSDSPNVDRCLGWEARQPDVRTWLRQRGMWVANEVKPNDPKEAMEIALRDACKARSSSIYEQLGHTVSVQRCREPSFAKFLAVLRGWFASEVAPGEEDEHVE